jgi:hypothetical protein
MWANNAVPKARMQLFRTCFLTRREKNSVPKTDGQAKSGFFQGRGLRADPKF